MRLYNTLSKKTEELQPLDGKTVRIYSCGPTVYDHAHIGNLSSFIYADILRRVIKASGHDVRHVMNFTDVDDKTITRSQEANDITDPQLALKTLTEHYADVFIKDMQAVGNDTEALEFKSATDHIPHMQTLIRTLLESGVAYVADDGVYFSIAEYKNRGKVYGQLIPLPQTDASEQRIQNDEYDKESVHDFALWKKHKDGEPSWDFEVNGQNLSGRPGWHIECSAMSDAALGLPFDIHTGGVDLIFPHHENEIAQSTASGGIEQMASLFFHNEHILVDGKKMSKSLNNFLTLEDVKNKGYDPLVFRLLVLQSHYRSQSNFSWQNLDAAKSRLEKWYAAACMRWQIDDAHDNVGKDFSAIIKTALQDDINTPEAMVAIDSFMSSVLAGNESNPENIEYVLDTVDSCLGMNLKQATPDISNEQRELMLKMSELRAAQDYSKADEVRAKLEADGLSFNINGERTVWSRLVKLKQPPANG